MPALNVEYVRGKSLWVILITGTYKFKSTLNFLKLGLIYCESKFGSSPSPGSFHFLFISALSKSLSDKRLRRHILLDCSVFFQYYANRYAESWLSKHHHVSSAGTSGLQSSGSGNEKSKRRDKKRKSHPHHSRTSNSASNVTLASGILSQP